MNLPTIEECQAFLAKINEGRALIDLEPLEYLDFDGAEPGNPFCCLSATNLFAHAGFKVMHDCAMERGEADDRLRGILHNGEDLPQEIIAVTDPFDACADDFWGENLTALRARMVEAGVVAP